jgi:hypothetical protein
MIDDDLEGLDPNDTDSIVRWSRRQQLRSRSPAEPAPEPQQTSQQDWQAFDERICEIVENYLEEIVATEAGRTERQLAARIAAVEQRVFNQEQISRRVTIVPPPIPIQDISAEIKTHCDMFFAGLGNDIREIRSVLELRRAGDAEIIDLPKIPLRRQA